MTNVHFLKKILQKNTFILLLHKFVLCQVSNFKIFIQKIINCQENEKLSEKINVFFLPINNMKNYKCVQKMTLLFLLVEGD